jgi:excinuclease ABC subunit A
VRILANGDPVDLSSEDAVRVEGLGLDVTAMDEILVVVDRLTVDRDGRDRLADSLSTCFVEGDGEAVVVVPDGRLRFTERFRCPDHPEITFLDPTPQLFSFNNPYGTCKLCTGFGATLDYDPDLIIPNPAISIADGAVDPWTKPRYRREREKLKSFTQDQKVSLFSPWESLPEKFRHAVMYGSKGFKGVIPFLVSREPKRYKQYIRVFLRKYQSPQLCRECGGGRIRPEALRVRVGERTISHVADLPLEELKPWVEELELTEMEEQIAESLLRELRARVAA